MSYTISKATLNIIVLSLGLFFILGSAENPPNITILGENPAIITKGSAYEDAGAKAEDAEDGVVKVITTGLEFIDTSIVKTYTITYTAIDQDNNIATKTRILNVIAAPDTTAPNAPRLTTTPTTTQSDSTNVEVNGEVGATVWANSIQIATIADTGKVTIALDTSGNNGGKTFQITLKDAANNESDPLELMIVRESEEDTTAPDAPTLTTTPTTTSQDSVTVEVNGEVGATVWVNGAQVATLNSNGKITVNLDTSGSAGDKAFQITLKDVVNNISLPLNLIITREVTDSTALNAPTLTTTPSVTFTDSTTVEINGESGTTVWINNTQVGTLDGNGKLTVDLDTSGSAGNKTFQITLKDSANNESEVLNLTITREIIDSTAPTTPTLTATPSRVAGSCYQLRAL